jgi:hemerythrin
MSDLDDASGTGGGIPAPGKTTSIIRTFREKAGISAADAARDISVSLEVYEKYEAGDQGIPIDVLYRAANRFGADFKIMLANKDSGMSNAFTCRAGEGGGIEAFHEPAAGLTGNTDSAPKQMSRQSQENVPVVSDKKMLEQNRQSVPADSDKGIVEWQRAYSTGISFLDEQHKEFINLANELYAASRMGWKQSQTAFMRTIRYTVQYFQTDLKNEEKIMERIDYPEYKEHKREHALFLKEIIRQTMEFREGRKNNAKDFILFLREWILSHVAICDKKLGFYLVKLRKEGNLSNIIMRVKIDERGAALDYQIVAPLSKTAVNQPALKAPPAD